MKTFAELHTGFGAYSQQYNKSKRNSTDFVHWKHLTCTAAFDPSTPTEAGSAKWKFLEFFKGQPFSSPARWGTNPLWDHAVGQRANVNWGEPFQQQKQAALTGHCRPSAGKHFRSNIKASMKKLVKTGLTGGVILLQSDIIWKPLFLTHTWINQTNPVFFNSHVSLAHVQLHVLIPGLY